VFMNDDDGWVRDPLLPLQRPCALCPDPSHVFSTTTARCLATYLTLRTTYPACLHVRAYEARRRFVSWGWFRAAPHEGSAPSDPSGLLTPHARR
jgi:hypothetical protein